MANAVWDSTLPQGFQLDQYQEDWANEVIRSQMDVGPDKIRRRGPAVSPIQANMIMSQAQVATLKTFFKTTLVGGSLPFDLTTVRPEGTVTRTYRFVKPPHLVAYGTALDAMVTLTLEEMPY